MLLISNHPSTHFIMKQLKQLLVFAFLAMSLVNCSKPQAPNQDLPKDPDIEEPQQEEPLPGEITGSVTVPDGADINFADYNIVSFAGTKSMDKNGDFSAGTVDGENIQQTMFMTDENDNVLMLAYLNGGTEIVELRAESSALGLFMMLSKASVP